MAPTAQPRGGAEGPTIAVAIPRDVQDALNRLPHGRVDLAAAEERAAEAAAQAVEEVWAAALARLQVLYSADG